MLVTRVTCPECLGVLHVPDELLGRPVACPKCGVLVPNDRREREPKGDDRLVAGRR